MMTSWAAIVAHCNKLTEKADAYYVNRRYEGLAAKFVNDLRFTVDSKPLAFWNNKRKLENDD
jgi:hypothetical protein